MRKFFVVLVLLLTSLAQAQNYCGLDTNLSAKVTLSNLALYSEQIDNAAWIKTASTAAANSITAPDGTLTADTLSETVSTSDHNIRQAIAVTTGLTYRFGGFSTLGTRSFIQISTTSTGFGTARYANFNLTNCTVGTVGASTTATAVLVGNRWCRVQIEATASATASTNMHAVIVTSGTAANFESYLGVATNNLYIWGLFANLSTSPLDYLPTTSAAATLGPLCARGTTQSLTDPSSCMSFDTPIYSKTPSQINTGR